MSILTVTLLILPVLLIAYPYLNHCWYMLAARKHGVSTPVTRYTFPLGLPEFYRMLRGLIKNTVNQENLEFALKSDGMTLRTQVLGSFAILTYDPENIKALLATQFKDFALSKRHKMFYELLGDGVFTLDGPGWQHTRAMLRPQFTREQISHVQIIETHLQNIINKCNSVYIDYSMGRSAQKYVNIQNLFFQLTIDTATEFLYGESTGLLSGGNPKIPNAVEFGDAFNKAQKVLSWRVAAVDFYWIFNSKNFQKWCKTCKDFSMTFVEMALEKTKDCNPSEKERGSRETSGKYIFLNELAKETRDPIILRDQALNILLAGRDTTASLLSWVFLMLGRHKNEFFKLREEILKEYGTGTEKLTFESLKRCLYLRHIINETLRLYPTVPNNFRYAIKDTTLPRGGGSDGSLPIFIPKGELILYSIYTTHRHPRTWGPDAQEFKPSRWNNIKQSDLTWSFLPFNGGPRICLGQQFALTEASYTIVRLLQCFKDINLDPAEAYGNPKESISLTLSVNGGVNVQLVPV